MKLYTALISKKKSFQTLFKSGNIDSEFLISDQADCSIFSVHII